MPLSQPIGYEIKTNCELPARVFPHLAPATLVVSSSDWFIGLSASVVIGQSDCFGLVLVWFYDTQLKPLYTGKKLFSLFSLLK